MPTLKFQFSKIHSRVPQIFNFHTHVGEIFIGAPDLQKLLHQLEDTKWQKRQQTFFSPDGRARRASKCDATLQTNMGEIRGQNDPLNLSGSWPNFYSLYRQTAGIYPQRIFHIFQSGRLGSGIETFTLILCPSACQFHTLKSLHRSQKTDSKVTRGSSAHIGVRSGWNMSKRIRVDVASVDCLFHVKSYGAFGHFHLYMVHGEFLLASCSSQHQV